MVNRSVTPDFGQESSDESSNGTRAEHTPRGLGVPEPAWRRGEAVLSPAALGLALGLAFGPGAPEAEAFIQLQGRVAGEGPMARPPEALRVEVKGGFDTTVRAEGSGFSLRLPDPPGNAPLPYRLSVTALWSGDSAYLALPPLSLQLARETDTTITLPMPGVGWVRGRVSLEGEGALLSGFAEGEVSLGADLYQAGSVFGGSGAFAFPLAAAPAVRVGGTLKVRIGQDTVESLLPSLDRPLPAGGELPVAYALRVDSLAAGKAEGEAHLSGAEGPVQYRLMATGPSLHPRFEEVLGLGQFSKSGPGGTGPGGGEAFSFAQGYLNPGYWSLSLEARLRNGAVFAFPFSAFPGSEMGFFVGEGETVTLPIRATGLPLAGRFAVAGTLPPKDVDSLLLSFFGEFGSPSDGAHATYGWTSADSGFSLLLTEGSWTVSHRLRYRLDSLGLPGERRFPAAGEIQWTSPSFAVGAELPGPYEPRAGTGEVLFCPDADEARLDSAAYLGAEALFDRFDAEGNWMGNVTGRISGGALLDTVSYLRLHLPEGRYEFQPFYARGSSWRPLSLRTVTVTEGRRTYLGCDSLHFENPDREPPRLRVEGLRPGAVYEDSISFAFSALDAVEGETPVEAMLRRERGPAGTGSAGMGSGSMGAGSMNPGSVGAGSGSTDAGSARAIGSPYRLGGAESAGADRGAYTLSLSSRDSRGNRSDTSVSFSLRARPGLQAEDRTVSYGDSVDLMAWLRLGGAEGAAGGGGAGAGLAGLPVMFYSRAGAGEPAESLGTALTDAEGRARLRLPSTLRSPAGPTSSGPSAGLLPGAHSFEAVFAGDSAAFLSWASAAFTVTVNPGAARLENRTLFVQGRRGAPVLLAARLLALNVAGSAGGAGVPPAGQGVEYRVTRLSPAPLSGEAPLTAAALTDAEGRSEVRVSLSAGLYQVEALLPASSPYRAAPALKNVLVPGRPRGNLYATGFTLDPPPESAAPASDSSFSFYRALASLQNMTLFHVHAQARDTGVTGAAYVFHPGRAFSFQSRSLWTLWRSADRAELWGMGLFGGREERLFRLSLPAAASSADPAVALQLYRAGDPAAAASLEGQWTEAGSLEGNWIEAERLEGNWKGGRIIWRD